MNERSEFVVRALLSGVGATMIMDLWALLLRQFGVPSLDFALLGRWLGHLPKGQWMHERIGAAAPVQGELILGWAAHYSIGIAFAALAIALFGLEWARSPDLSRALLIGLVTVAAPLLILQPALGAGIASSKTAAPVFNAVKSVVTHLVYGAGLYAAGRATGLLLAAAK